MEASIKLVRQKYRSIIPYLMPYRPLLTIIAIIVISALALNYRSPMSFMHIFMGLFFVVFAMFKLFDLEGFVNGFVMYDIIAQKFRNYAYAYPFIEVILGLAYLSGIALVPTDLFTMALMFLSAAGVMRAINQGVDLKCACLGTALNVPLSMVTLIENIGMGLMALLSLL